MHIFACIHNYHVLLINSFFHVNTFTYFLKPFLVPDKGECRKGELCQKYKLPARFSDGVITKTVRSEIITVIALGMWQITTQPTSEEYTSICRALVQKFPVLKDTHGNGYVSCVLAKDHCVSYYLFDMFFP